jgi:choice-of-anchor A domain-containing protein
VAGKALNLANGKVYSGDALYGSSATIGNDVTFSTACQRVMNASVINWTFAQSEISRIAAGLKAMPANGQYSVSNGVLTLSGPAQFVSGSLLVFSVKLLDLLGAQSISFSNFPKAADIKAIVFNADVSGFTIPDNFAFSLPQSWSLSALEGSDYKNKLIWNFDQLAASLSFSNTDNSTHEVFGAVLAPNVALNCGASRMKIYGSLFLKSLSGMYLISEHLSSDFCLADLVSVAITTQPATLPATTQPATVTPTMVQTVTTFVPSVIGTTKIPATTQPAK